MLSGSPVMCNQLITGCPSAIRFGLTRIAALNKLSSASKNCLITTLPYLAISLHYQGFSQHDNHLRLTNEFSVNTHLESSFFFSPISALDSCAPEPDECSGFIITSRNLNGSVDG